MVVKLTDSIANTAKKMYIKIKTKYEVMFCEVVFWIFEPRDDEQHWSDYGNTDTVHSYVSDLSTPR